MFSLQLNRLAGRLRWSPVQKTATSAGPLGSWESSASSSPMKPSAMLSTALWRGPHAPISGQFATGPKSVISLHPPWTVASQGEKVKLICNGPHFSQPGKATWYRWYHRGEISSETLTNTHEVHDSGEYSCQTSGSLLSNPVSLLFSAATLILQAPLYVFEGDSVVLRCRAKAGVALTNVTLYKNDRLLAFLSNTSDFQIHQAHLKDNGAYHCTGFKKGCCSIISNRVNIQVQEHFQASLLWDCCNLSVELLHHPVLRANSSWPTEGEPVTLTCEIQLPPQRSDVRLQFCFFKDGQILGPGWSSSPEFQINTIWREDSGSYWCKAQTVTSRVWKQSRTSQIYVQRVVANVQMHTRPALELVFAGHELVLICSVDGVPGPVRIFWYKTSNKKPMKAKIQNSLNEEFKISMVKKRDAGEYYCEANNGRLSFRSKPVTINVKVPVAPPGLTLSPPGDRAPEGVEVTLQCKAQRGSLPIQYQFFREDVFLKEIEVTSLRTSSFSFSLTAEHSGNYYCTADNGLGAQRSRAVHLSVITPVSPPLLTLSPPGPWAVEGDLMTLHCVAQKGSPPIQYQFYHGDVTLGSSSIPSGVGASFSFSLTSEHSGNYHCTADNGFGSKHSDAVSLSVTVPVSRPVLTLRAPGAQTVVGDVVELHCEAQRGSPPILYQFYRNDVTLESNSSLSGGGSSFKLSLTEEHSGNYSCEANNGLGVRRSDAVSLRVTVPVSRPVLTLRAPRAQTVVGDVMELHCEAHRGSPPILYQFYHADVTLGSSLAPSGGGAFFNLSLTAEHSGNYSCEANNDLGSQRSEMVMLNVLVPVSRPVLTLRAPGAQTVVGDVVELHCEAQRGSPPIQYRFYRNDVTLESNSSLSGGGSSFNLSLTEEHSGNYSCEANNGLAVQRSDTVTLSITRSRSGPVATGVTGGLISVLGLAAAGLLFYYWLPRKAGRRPTSDLSRSPSNSDPQEPTYHSVPAWVELQPVYSNGEDVIYTEVRSIQKGNKNAAASTPRFFKNSDSSVIYSQVRVASTPASRPQFLASSAPIR
ncbi:Fc receptor-like protein 5 isoform X6 [Equus asinus]|uniref:Fc receptor-like protein 5 isoform X6 n=1 Tax=Equus asinus TaxID=9793 RepID=UPI0038F6039C